MGKYKVAVRGNLITVTHKQLKKFAVNQRELEVFSNRVVPGFFRPNLVKENKLEYNAPYSITLKEYLKAGLTIEKLINILMQIIEATKTVEQNHLYLQNVVLDDSFVFINQYTGEAFFIYEPLTDNDNTVNVYAFVLDLLSGIKTSDQALKDEVQTLLDYLNNDDRYKIEDIEELISNLVPDYEFTKPKGWDATPGASRRMNVSYSGEISSSHFSASLKENPVDVAEEDEGGTTILAQEDDMVLFTEDEGTTLLNEPAEEEKLAAFITRVKTGEEFEVTGNRFLIGKGNDCDYQIDGNPAISRHHATIVLREDEYYVVDEFSKNHTWIDGKQLDPEQEANLTDGSQVKMADEEFIFTIK